MKTRIAVGLVFAVLFSGSLGAGVVPGRWEKVDALDEGTPMLVLLHSGERLRVTLVRSDADSLMLLTEDGIPLLLPKPQVKRITGVEAIRDRLHDGTLIGLAAGFAAGFVGLAAYNAHVTAGGPIWDGEALGYYAGAGLLGAGIGALAGAVIDASARSPEEYYRSPGLPEPQSTARSGEQSDDPSSRSGCTSSSPGRQG